MPNFLIIDAHDLGYGDVTTYYAFDLSTSNLDRLAAEGVRFRNAFFTNSLCAPSSAANLTGLCNPLPRPRLRSIGRV